MTRKNQPVKVRFAPSPTGFLHIGGLRTALYNYLFAKQNGGKFALRIEDTDRTRIVAGAEENIIDTLNSFGLTPDEGPLRQSERLDLYKKYADELKSKNLVYEDEGALRFKMDREGLTEFTDIIRGKIEIDNKDQEDFVIIKSDGYPTYNFAHIVDDYEMGVTHVIRGEEFIPSMPKYVALHKALGWDIPQYAHLPLLLSKTRAKLSKREGDVAVKDYLTKGYIKEAIINFVALLGWHPSESEKEIFTLEELIKEFKLEEVQKGGAIFDLDKLNWFQHVWAVKINQENNNQAEKHPLYSRVKEALKTEDTKILSLLWPHVIERMGAPEELDKLSEEFSFFFSEPDYSVKMLIWKKSDQQSIQTALNKLLAFLKDLDDQKWGRGELEGSIKDFIARENLDTGTVLWPLRVALTGKEKSMGPFEIMDVFNRLGQKEIIFERINRAILKLKNHNLPPNG